MSKMRHSTSKFLHTVEREGPLQSGLCQLEWLHLQISGREYFGHQEIFLDIPDKASQEDIQKSVDYIVSRHEALRSTFGATKDGEPVQRVLNFQSIDISISFVDDISEVDEVLQKAYYKKFFFSDEPPIRATVINTSGGDRKLYLTLAHMTADLGSSKILSDELEHALSAYMSGGVPYLSPPDSQPIDLALEQRSSKGKKRQKKSLKYWSRELSEMPMGLFPTPAPDDHGFVEINFRSRAAKVALEILSRRYSTESAIIAASAFAYSLRVVTGQSDIPLNFTWAMRTTAHTRNIVGPVFRDMVLWLDMSGRTCLREIVDRARLKFFHGARNMDFDLFDFLEEKSLASERRGSLFHSECVFNFALDERAHPPPRNKPTKKEWQKLLGQSRVTTTSLESSKAYSFTNLWTGIYPAGDGLRLFMSAKKKHLGQPQVEELAHIFETLLVQESREEGSELPSVDLSQRTRAGFSEKERIPFDRSWVCPKTVTDLLQSHPSVVMAEVRTDTAPACSLAALIATTDPDLNPHDIRDFLLDKLEPHHDAASPNHFSIFLHSEQKHAFLSPWEKKKLISEGSGRERIITPPSTWNEHELATSILLFHHLENIYITKSYVANGGNIEQAPCIIKDLANKGLSGLALNDFLGPASLKRLAARLRSTKG